MNAELDEIPSNSVDVHNAVAAIFVQLASDQSVVLRTGLLTSECQESGAQSPISCGRQCSRLLKMTYSMDT